MKARVVTWARSLSLVHEGRGWGQDEAGLQLTALCHAAPLLKRAFPFTGVCLPACFSCPKIIEMGR